MFKLNISAFVLELLVYKFPTNNHKFFKEVE